VQIFRAIVDAAKGLRRETFALYLAIRHPQTPWYARAVAAAVVLYAVSPIDLIPDPIPVLGHLDDLIVVPLGVLLVRRLIPSEVLLACRRMAAQGVEVSKAWRWGGGLLIGCLWVLGLGLIAWACWR
jgi:uncharacterized membrane protein YkvA (DUF1232 family)